MWKWINSCCIFIVLQDLQYVLNVNPVCIPKSLTLKAVQNFEPALLAKTDKRHGSFVRKSLLEKMNAKLHIPLSVFVSNGEVFIAYGVNHRVRKLLRNDQIVSIAGDGSRGYGGSDGQLATLSQLSYPSGVVVSSSNQVYITEEDNHPIRKIDRHGIISTIAGNGIGGYNGDNQLAIHAQLYYPHGLFVNDEEEIYFCDGGNCRVRKIDRFGMISTIAGNGGQGYNGDDILATTAQLKHPTGVFVYKNEVYISDTNNHRIRKVLKNGIIKTIAGNGTCGYNGDDQLAINACLYYPEGIFAHNDIVYFSDYNNHRVRLILPNGMIKTIAGNETGGTTGNGKLAIGSQIKCPSGLFADDSGIYICCENSVVRKVGFNGMLTTIVGTGKHGYSEDVPFDFSKYPHIGPRKKKSMIKPFPHAYRDLIVICVEMD